MTSETIASGLPVMPVTVLQAAELFGTTDKTVRTWIRSGLPTLKGGKKGAGNGALIDLAVLIPWYLEDNALEVAKTRLAAAQSDKYEMENAVRRGELLDTAEVTAAIGDHIAAARARLLSMHSKLSPQLTNVADPNIIAGRIKAEVNAAIAELASYDPDAVAQKGRTYLDTTAESDGEPVVGRKSKAKQRK